MQSQLVSIVIPLFNREELIKQTLDSVLVQTYSNWECIIVDDGSADNSYLVAKQFAEKDSRIMVFQREHEPKGAPECREIGRNKSKGEYLIYLDSDDLLAPWALKERVQYFLNNPHLDVLLSNGLQFNSKDKKFLDYTAIYQIDNVLTLFLQMHTVFQTTSPTWKRTFIDRNNICWDAKTAPWDDVDYAISAFSCNTNFHWSSIVPDYFMRKDDDPNALTSLTNIVPKVVSNFYTYEKWLKNGDNQPALKKYFPDYMLRKLEYLLPEKDLKIILTQHSALIKKHLGRKTISYLNLYNKTRNIPLLRGIVYRARPFLTNIKHELTLKQNYHFNETMREELLKRFKDYQSNPFLNYERA
jgi:glycosyltransferase involved in cell wall biosynthesis